MTEPRRVTTPGEPRQAPPAHDLDAEEALLGACLLARPAIGAALGVGLEPDDFYRPSHGLVFAALRRAYLDGKPVDGIVIAAALREAGTLEEAGGSARLAELAAGAPSLGAARAESYARIVRGSADERRMAGAVAEAAEVLRRPGSPEEKRAEIAGLLGDVLVAAETAGPSSIGDWSRLVLEEAEQGPPPRLTTGLVDLDRALGGGLVRGHLALLAARPSMGKTALALNVALGAARAGCPVLFETVEMPGREIVRRALACSPRGVRLAELERVHEDERVAEAAWRTQLDLAALPLELVEGDRSVPQIVARARRLAARPEGLALVVVDYLQLLDVPAGERREREVAGISRHLKLLARELDVVVLAVAQLNREVERRTDKRPMLADLKDSGQLEQDADVVMFIYRDEVYDPDSGDAGTAELGIAKHRNGPTGLVRLGWQPERTRFVGLAPDLHAIPGGAG
jgi:replicative DNA helicase